MKKTCSLYLNSKDADNNAHPTWQITDGMILYQRKMKLKLMQIQFPNYVYPLQSGSNTIAFTETASPEATYTVPPGIYNADELAALISAGMTNASPNLKTYVMTFDYNTYRFTLTYTGATITQLTSNTTINSYLGTFPLGSIAASFTTSYPPILSGTDYVDIMCNLSLVTSNSASTSTTLCRVELNENFGNQILYEPTHEVSHVLTNERLQTISLTLRDDQSALWTLPANATIDIVFEIEYF